LLTFSYVGYGNSNVAFSCQLKTRWKNRKQEIILFHGSKLVSSRWRRPSYHARTRTCRDEPTLNRMDRHYPRTRLGRKIHSSSGAYVITILSPKDRTLGVLAPNRVADLNEAGLVIESSGPPSPCQRAGLFAPCLDQNSAHRNTLPWVQK
jgi:hypothetical protein